MRLYLVQHGDALPKETDPDRPLSDPGRADVEALAGLLGRCGVRAERVLHSGKTRAEQTAAILRPLVAPAAEMVATKGLGPTDSVYGFAGTVQSWTHPTIVVGHLQFLSRLASRLITGHEDAHVAAFVPGSMLCLEHGEHQGWTVAWMVRPELLSVGVASGHAD